MNTREKELSAWAIEWEGSVGFRSANYGTRWLPTVAIGNTSKELLEEFLKIVKTGKIYGPYDASPSKWNRKKGYSWRLSKMSRIRDFLMEICPYLKTKMPQAILVAHFCYSRLSHGSHRVPYTEDELSDISKVYELNGGEVI